MLWSLNTEGGKGIDQYFKLLPTVTQEQKVKRARNNVHKKEFGHFICTRGITELVTDIYNKEL